MDLKLVIGSKSVSSWSLRPWLALKHAGVNFEEIVIPLDRPETREKIARYSPSGRVPVLIDGDLVVWDSLAICEYLAEKFPYAELWPLDLKQRAKARAISAEMHAGFSCLRQQLSMNLKVKKKSGSGPSEKQSAVELKTETQTDIDRIQQIWRESLLASGGPFLFGPFTIADAMFAPVATRFQTYSVPYHPDLELYIQAILNLPAMRQWIAAAQLEEA